MAKLIQLDLKCAASGVVPDNLKPGEWTRGGGGRKVTYLAVYCCPLCRCLVWLKAKAFDADRRGVVRPGLACTGEGCDFMGRITLEGWVE